MGIFEVGGGLVLGIVILVALKVVLSLPLWLIKNSIVGAVMLWLFNLLGIFTLKITFIHCLIVGIFGVPGIVGLLIYLNFLK